MGGGGGYSSPILCVPQLASPLFYQLPALRCKTRQNECHGIESPTFISFLRKLSKCEKIIPGVVLVKLSAEQRNKWRKSPPFTTIFPYNITETHAESLERDKKITDQLQKFFAISSPKVFPILMISTSKAKLFRAALIYNASLTTSSHYPLEYRTFLTILTLFSNLLLLAIMINHDGHPRGIKPCTFGVALQLSTMPKRHTMPNLLKLPTTYCFFNYFPLSFFRFKNARHNA